MLHVIQVLQVHSQRGVACEINALHVWPDPVPWRSARAQCAHTVYDVITWSWVNLVNPFKIVRAFKGFKHND